MTHYTEFVPKKLVVVKNRKQQEVYNEIFCFDIETTSGYIIGGKLIPFEFEKPKTFYEDKEKFCFMYIWQFGINETVYYGRTWAEFTEFMETLKSVYPHKKIVFVHNLSYEFQYLLNIIESDIKPFARKPHKVMKFDWNAYNIEMRCSYVLSNMSLETIANSYKLPVRKLTGNLDYTTLHFPTTKLTDIELAYCENDILVMYHFLSMFKEQYKNVYDIPLTQTGEVRREVKKLFKNDSNYFRKVWQLVPRDCFMFKILLEVFAGGYTHANYIHTEDVLENVKSKDLSSSYPASMCAFKYPMSQFIKLRSNDINVSRETYKDNCFIFDVTFERLNCKTFNTFISLSKCKNVRKSIVDNGRLRSADTVSIKVTDVDFSIIESTYEWESITVNAIYTAKADYLDKRYILKILELFGGKTTLKGIEESESLYMKKKQYINSLFGMMVTNVISDEVVFSDKEWQVEKITLEDINEKLNKQRNSRNTFLSFAWGVWVTAYSRRALWQAIQSIDYDVVYCDTDSVKYIGEHEDFFTEYNKNIKSRLCEMCKHYNIDEKMLHPKDINGTEHWLGIFDVEPTYTKFKTLGAKKYIGEIEKDGKKVLKMTVSGVSKKAVKSLKSVDDFCREHVFGCNESGRLIMTYSDDFPSIKYKDDTGEHFIHDCRYGIHAMPTTYTMDIADEYNEFLELSKSCVNATILTE